MAFSDLIGQDKLKERLSQEAKSPHVASYILSGPEGFGKKSFAEEFAMALICENPGDNGACGQCKCCKYMKEGTLPDVLRLVPAESGKQIKAEAVRDVIEDIIISPQFSSRKICLVDLDHMTETLQNLLLKPTEDPPKHVIFIMTTSAYPKVISTLRSRSVNLVLLPYSDAQIAKILSDRLEGVSSDKINEAVEFSAGNPGKAISLAQDPLFSDLKDDVMDLILAVPVVSYTNILTEKLGLFTDNKDRADDILILMVRALEDILKVKVAEKNARPDIRYEADLPRIERFISQYPNVTASTIGRSVAAVEELRSALAVNANYEASCGACLLKIKKEFDK